MNGEEALRILGLFLAAIFVLPPLVWAAERWIRWWR